MIRVRQIKVSVEHDSIGNIKKNVAFKLNIRLEDIKEISINKQSLDARKKPNLYYLYEVDVKVDNEDKILSNFNTPDILKTPNENYVFNVTGDIKLNNRVVIVGTGPAGLFAALNLAKAGYKPLIIERGKKVEDRVKDVENFWKTGILDTSSNVQFGEGGAGTFSDGKLNTMVKDKEHRCKEVFKVFVEAGADDDILYVNKPHIGTDILRDVIKNIREDIISFGGEFRFETCLTNIITKDNKLIAIEVNNNEIINTDVLILAIGHSSRDTFNMLYNNKINMEAKPFAVGVRVQHKQSMINKSQLGVEEHPLLPNASYKLTYNTKDKRGVYTFCMCPGGYVVNSSSEEGRLAINGMSNHDRESENANSAVIVTVSPSDFGTNPLDGIKYQQKLEEITYKVGNGNIPTQKYIDFKNNKDTKELGSINPVFKGNYTLANLNNIFPKYITSSIVEAMDYWDSKIKGYNADDTLIAAIESRTSSPVKLIRDEYLESNIKGIYPAGEGAGYAGGITSAAMDGMKISEEIAKKYRP